ncbi:unnamed protein product (macronuclear) [Paramecium tetraurelia]|uniref:C2H2-type domain-containing protein n=1 Tax=Paramecium tetraurelia TaxID=5888 RepID=A0E9F2_PARTE|nr:uncharacterized protein GSPATT00024650001 [Paramecium tetraurelia]CAK91919.1 unnamed protein product [Paramecium tetraurelia]|eukprot:XP_001459316.1 hypothetical protein (macronuclear) [Paramecium tetraurelia strain d4-2]
MNEEIRSILKKILEMQLDCTQILTTILFKNDDSYKDEELHKAKVLLEEQKNQIELGDKKQKKKHLNYDKAGEVANKINSENHRNVILDINSQLKLTPQECYQKLNYIIQDFRQRNKLTIKPQSCDFEYIKNYHSKVKFKELRNMIKLVVNNMENKKNVISKANGQKVIQCPSCDFQGFSGVYFPHILKKHCQNYYIFSCFLCYRDFQSYILLKKHLKRYHKQVLNNSSDVEIIKVQYDDNDNELSINI